MRKWKVILSITCVFVAGLVIGSVLTLRVVKEAAKRQLSPERWPATLVDSYRQRLRLTPEQIEKLKPVIEESRREWQETMRTTVSTHLKIIRRIDEQLSPVLTDEQRKIQEQIRQDIRRRLRERFKQLPDS